MKTRYIHSVMGASLALLLAAAGSIYAGPGRGGDGPRQGKRGSGDEAPWLKGGGEEKHAARMRDAKDRPSREEILNRFDTDKDGTLNEEEKAAMREARKQHGAGMKAKMLEQFDADGDGVLSDDEKAAAREARSRKQNRKLPEHVINKFDTDGDGRLNESEREAARTAHNEHRQKRHQKMLEQFDTDGDGELNKDERTALRKHRNENGHQKGPRGKKRDGNKSGPGPENDA